MMRALIPTVAAVVLVAAGVYRLQHHLSGPAGETTTPPEPTSAAPKPALQDQIQPRGPLSQEIQQRDPSDLQPGDHPEPQSYPSDPESAVAQIVASLSEVDQRQALADAGMFYGKQGTEMVKRFVRALPAKSISFAAATAALKQTALDDIPGMIAWVGAHAQALGTGMTDTAVTALTWSWAERDLATATAFIADEPGIALDTSVRANQVSLFLEGSHGVDAPEVLRILAAIEDDEVRTLASLSAAGVQAMFSAGSASAVVADLTSIEDPDLRQKGLYGLSRKFKKLANTPEVMKALAGATFPEKNGLLPGMARRWMQSDLDLGLSWLATITDPALFDAVVDTSWKVVAAANPQAALELVANVKNARQRTHLESQVTEYLGQ